MAERRLVIMLLASALVTLGLALGAELQAERHFAPVAETQDFNSGPTGGDPVPVTSILVAGGVALGVAALAPRPAPSGTRPRRALWAWLPLLSLATYLVVNLLQTTFPADYSLVVHDGGSRAGQFRETLLISNGPALSVLLLPIFALLVACGLAISLAGRRIWRDAIAAADEWGDRAVERLPRLLSRQMGAIALVAPFVFVAAAGNLRLVTLVSSQPDSGLAVAVLALSSLVLLALLASAVIKAWQLARCGRDARLAPVAYEAWVGLGRAEAALALGFLALAAVGTFGPALQPSVLANDRTFVVTLQRHLQLMALALVPFLPMLAVHRDALRALRDFPPAAGPARRVWPTFWFGVVGLPFAAAGAAFAAWSTDGIAWRGAVWGWVLASLPLALAAMKLEEAAAGPMLLSAVGLWCVGNSVFAIYDTSETGVLQFSDNTGINALLRLAAAVLAGLAVARLVRAWAPARRASIGIPLSLGVGMALAAVALLELPLALWTGTSSDGQWVGLGTQVAQQSEQSVVVADVMHFLALMAISGAALCLAALLRPEWFPGRRRGRPLATSVRERATG